MPIIKSQYRAPSFLLRSGHFQTIYSSFFRKFNKIEFTRERITTPDNDFLDLDWKVNGSDKLAILSHGLEGSSRSKYIRANAGTLSREGFDVLAWNLRGCSGEPNLHISSYHSGKSEDLQTVIEHALQLKRYSKIVLIGFSIGGNITLKFLGELGVKLPPEIVGSVVISAPVDLAGCAKQMTRKRNSFYLRWFTRKLNNKTVLKKKLFPTELDISELSQIKRFEDFDKIYTAPLNGFSSYQEYYEKSSSKPLLNSITCPTLIINGQDDSFLSNGCYPVEEAKRNPNLFLEIPKHGGHVGFMSGLFKKVYWHESRVVEFLSTL